MNIALVCHSFRPFIGGVEIQVEETAKELAGRGWHVEVVTTDQTMKLAKSERSSGFEVTRFASFSPGNSYHFTPGIIRYIRRRDFDLIHAFSYRALPACEVAWLCYDKPIVFTSLYTHGSPSTFREILHKFYRVIGKRIFDVSQKIIYQSEFEKNLIKNKFQVPEEKLFFIPPGVEVGQFAEIRQQLKDKECSYDMILCVARLEEYKGIQYIIKAFPKLPKEIHLEVVGKGPYKQELVKLSEKLRVRDRVHFFEGLTRRKLIEKYCMSKLFILLSRFETYGMSVAEALASNTACILANKTALSEWIDNKSCFGIEDPDNTEKLVDIIMKNIGKQVQNSKLWSWRKIVNRLEKLYEEAIIPNLDCKFRNR